MSKSLLAWGAAAALLLFASCTSVQYSSGSRSDVKESSPEDTFYRVLKALRTGDEQTARQWTLYGEYVNWDQVMREARSLPRKYRVGKIIYKDATPQMFSASMIYYTAADGNSYVAEFTRLGGKWYWGSRIDSGMARLLRARAAGAQGVERPQE